MTSDHRDLPAITLDGNLDHTAVVTLAREHLAPHLDSFLYQQRWFGDKDRPLASVAVRDAVADPVADGWLVMATAVVRFADGGDPADYLLLGAVRQERDGDQSLLRVTTPGGEWRFVDIVAAPDFPAWWLRQFELQRTLPGDLGTFAWRQFAEFGDAVADAGPGRLITGGMGQSNTTIRYDDVMFGKVFRRLRPGINPDEEVSRFLAERTSFRHLPVPFGAVSYQATNGDMYPVGVLFQFAPNVGEGWGWTQELLATEPIPPYAAAARRLGERTGQLHLALASVDDDPEFAPEPVTRADIDGWRDTTVANLRQVLADLRARSSELAPHLRQMIATITEREPVLIEQAAGFEHLAGTVKTRIHGDYHLGQLLRTPDDDWILLDFEGEPARTIAERRAKTSPLKDAADLLRSFGYARGMASRSPAADRGRLVAWEQEARREFLAGYRGEVAGATVPLAPASDAEFAAAIAAWELAKASYEVRYELGNRPDWLDVPLSTLIVPDA